MINWRNSRFAFRSVFLLVILVLPLAGADRANAQANGCAGVPNDVQGGMTWNPNWCQEFNSTVPGPPDTTVWNFDLGNSGFGNNEIETYCGPPGFPNNPSQCPTIFSPSTSNAYIDGSGHLLIRAFTTGGTWYSARLNTGGKQDFKFGRIEGRIQLPDTTNQGLWPAFWSLGSNISTVPWPGCGEADILEVWSPSVLGGPGPTGNRSTLHTAATDGSGVQPNGQFTFPGGQANTAFHTYGMIWSANMQQYYIDDPLHPYYIATTSDLKSGDTWPFNLNIFLLMNIAVGGTLGGTPSSSTPNPGVMMVDYVRQYQPAAAVIRPILGNPPAITVKAGAITGNSATLTPGLTSGTGFVYFSCSTNAPKASCSVATNDPLNTHVVNSSPIGAAETATVTVATTANAILPPFFLDPWMRIWMPITIAGLLALLIVALALRAQSRARRQLCGIAAVLILVGVVAIAGCGGGSSVNPPPPSNGTPPGSYTVTVYAFTEGNTSDGTNANADANVAIPLIVN
jgi:beta-glucanase (GH16 family)